MLERTLVVGAGGFLGSDTEEKIQGFLPRLDEMVQEGLATVEKATVIFYRPGDRPPEG
jgi:hypothetical protein